MTTRFRTVRRLAMLLLVAAPALAQDMLVLRDGTRRTGELQACVSAQCRLDGQTIGRAEIAWIGLGEQGTPPTPGDPAGDEIWLRDERAQPGPVLGISLGVVATETGAFDRAEVSWVYLGSAAGLPPLPSSAAAPAPPVPRAPPEGPGHAALPAIPSPPGPAPAPTATLLLNEIRFLPAEGEAQFVELQNASAERIPLEDVSLRNEKGQAFELPKDLAIEPGAFLLVLFDGEKGGEPGVVHASATALLGESGALWLRIEERLADGVTWGMPTLSSVDLCRGGRCSPVQPGSVIARLPGGERPLTPAAWALLDPELATPGEPNPRPPVSIFAVLPGTVFAGLPRFSWYSVPGAASYRLEVAKDRSFAAVVHTRTVAGTAGVRLEQLTAQGSELSPGSYFWRVQAVGAEGEEAAFSRPVPFRIRSRPPAARSARAPMGDFTRAQAQGNGAQGPSPAPSPDESVCQGRPAESGVCKELPVPIIKHQKDTKMLTLEASSERPPGSWDTPDQASYPYCARAGVAMVNAYYHAKLNLPGRLSQDRIGYEAFKGLHPGAEYDLPVVGIVNSRTDAYTLPLAFGTSGEYHASPSPFQRDFRLCRERNIALGCGRTGPCPPCPVEMDYAWGYEALRNIQQEIDAERPLIVTGPGHLYLIVGYVQNGDELSIITQDGAGREEVGLQDNDGEVATWVDGRNVIEQLDGNEAVSLQLLLDAYWTALAPVEVGSDEPELRDETDSDGDGVLDFDELERFGTEPDQQDSDDDGVNDKEEIRYSVWDPDHGYHNSLTSLESIASDDAVVAAAESVIRDPMELLPDSDGGGCEDGEEDLNGNGIRAPGETSNFDPADDPTIEPGECAEQWTGTSQTRIWSREQGEWFENDVTAEWRWREVSRQPIIDPGPEHGGREAGARVGTWSEFTCAGTTLYANWRAFIGPASGHTGSDGSCTSSGSGGTTVVDAEPRIDGIILRKHVDWDVTPLLGFDLPRGGGLYSLSCGRDEPSFTVETSCSWGFSVSETAGFSQLAIGLGIPGTTARCHHDPEVRYLEGGGNLMTGSYSVFDPSSECAPQGAAMTWSLCKVGTPCAPLPPLPTGEGDPEPGGAEAEPPS